MKFLRPPEYILMLLTLIGCIWILRDMILDACERSRQGFELFMQGFLN